MAAVEVPLELPLDASLPEQEDVANALLDEARAVGDRYGIKVVPRLVRTRSFGRTIVDEAKRHSEVVIVGADRRNAGRRRQVFSDVVDFTLKHAPCRVMVAAAPPHPEGLTPTVRLRASTPESDGVTRFEPVVRRVAFGRRLDRRLVKPKADATVW